MRNLICKIGLMTILICSAFSMLSAQVNYVNYNSGLDPVLEKRVNLMSLVMEGYGYKLSDYTLINLKEGENFEGATTCYGGYEYEVYAISASGVKDVDLYIYESDRRLVTYTLENKDIGVTALNYRMNSTDDMIIKVKNYDSSTSYKDYQIALVVYYKAR